MALPVPLKHEISKLQRQITAQRRLLKDREIQGQKERRRAEIMGILSHHIGRQNAIGMGELYTRVYNKEWRHRINDTRKLRADIEALQNEGRNLCSTVEVSGGGYYLPASDSEWEDFKQRRIMMHAKGINRIRKMHKISVAEAMRQVQLVLEEGETA